MTKPQARAKTRLRFEEKEKPIPGGRQQHNPLSRPVQEVGVFVHNKIHSVEKTTPAWRERTRARN